MDILFFDAKVIFMERESDINGVVRATFEVTGHVCENDAGERIAGLVEQTLNMIIDNFLLEVVDRLFKFFCFGEFVKRLVFENINTKINGFG